MLQRSLWFLCVLLIFLNNANGQTIQVRGVVKDVKGQPVSGASVMEKNTQKGVATDSLGVFTIIINQGSVITITAVGFADTAISVGNQSDIRLTLRQKTTAMNTVV